MYTIAQIATVLKGTTHGLRQDMPIEHILLDSRKLLFPASSAFFALAGARRSGHDFIDDLYQKGVQAFVVDEQVTEAAMKAWPGAVFLQVKDTLQALQSLASFHRHHFSLPVIGITGSNGKTIVKEWLFQLLSADHRIVRSPKSYNSQIGVPLSVWQINKNHTLGIFEAGISQPDEMHHLARILDPSIGVFTSLGDAHSEGFLNIRQKVNEKLRLFVKSDVLIFCADEPDLNEAVNGFNNNARQGDDFKMFTWSRKTKASLQVLSVKSGQAHTAIKVLWRNETFEFTIPFTDNASIENAITCCCVLLYLQVDVNTIMARMPLLRSVEMRLQLKQGINNCSIINDSYSADINSLKIALDFLKQQRQHKKRTLILSDILQSGRSGGELYAEVAAILEKNNISRFIGIGAEISKQRQAFKNIQQLAFYSSTAEFKQHFHSQHFNNETILLKGARMYEFEQISHLLEEKIHQTVLEIDLNAITHNLKTYQQLLAPGVKIMAMVKAFSYGSGSFEIANLLQFHRVDYLAVAYTDEGVELRKAGITLPIMVMNVEEVTFDMLVQYNLEPELFSFGILSAFADYLAGSGITNYPVHIKLDTGMRRLGFEKKDVAELCRRLKDTNVFKIQSVFSHLAASDSVLHDDFTRAQAETFLEGCEQIHKAAGYSFIRHIANTSAIHRHKDLQLDMIRLGIGMYGVDADPEIQQKLRNVTTLKTTISQVKKVQQGKSIGYNRTGIALQDSEIATVRIGYADGYPRLLSNGVGKMWINGKMVPVIGNVCMDMTMLDVTGVEANEGDEVIVFGAELPVTELAKLAHSIPYEVLTGISQRVKRVYFQE